MTTLTPTQQARLQSLIVTGNYADGYRYVNDIVDAAHQGEPDPAKANDLEITSSWLDNAVSINANDGSFKSDFVRAATKSAGEQVGKTISDADFQDTSDDLASKILSQIASSSAVCELKMV